MSEDGKRILQEALALPTEERARIAVDLIASIDGEPDADAEAAWAEEIERRAREGSPGADWATVRKRIERTLGG